MRPGTRYRDIGDIISTHASRNGFQIVKSYCGHGIGDLFHCAPTIPHYARNKARRYQALWKPEHGNACARRVLTAQAPLHVQAVGTMKAGQTFTIEPMVNAGSWRDVTWPDGWTSATEDGKCSAQFEHTLLVTDTGCNVLTARLPTSPPLWWET